MKIGIEASRLTEKQRTGTENYLYNLVKCFSDLDHENEYILYLRERPSEKLWSELSNGNPKFSYKALRPFLSWTQVSLAMELLRSPPDVLFCPWHTMPGLNPFWKMKTVSAFHDATGWFIPSFWTVKFSSKIICVSKRTRDEVVRRFRANLAKLSVVYEGYDQRLSPTKKRYDGIEGDYILFLGSLGPRKNLEKMVEAYLRINTEADFVVAGKVLPGSENLAKLPVKYIGRAGDADLSALYSGAAFLAFASKEEGFGLPILEAQSCGTPVLASDISVMREIAGDAALFVNPDSVDSIQEGMQKLLIDENLRRELARKGFENIKRFSWENSARQILEVFEKVANGK